MPLSSTMVGENFEFWLAETSQYGKTSCCTIPFTYKIFTYRNKERFSFSPKQANFNIPVSFLNLDGWIQMVSFLNLDGLIQSKR